MKKLGQVLRIDWVHLETKKIIKISNSGINRYNGCPASYKYHYLDRLRSPVRSSALLFGSAVDAACNHLLENHGDRRSDPKLLEEAILIFKSKWEQQLDQNSSTGEVIDLPKNPYIKYFKNDYDHSLFSEDILDVFEEQLGVTDSELYLKWREENFEKYYKGKSFLGIPEEERISYNYGSWLSLSKKGPMMIEAYFNNILPQFKSILTLQRQIEVVDDKDNVVQGIAEFVAELHDGRVCLVDNKTASSPYSEDSVRNSQQLALYKQILNIQARTEGADWKIPIDCAAYAVMIKKTEQNKTCSACGFNSASSHKTCNNTINGSRCGGEWKLSPFHSTQFIIDNITEEFGNAVLENASTVISCVEKSAFPKNFERCYNVFGGACEFLEHCRGKGDSTLIKLGDSNNGKK